MKTMRSSSQIVHAPHLLHNELPLIVLRGLAGSGKTSLLHALQEQGEQVLDLEKLACHKGSVFGHLGMPPQPSQEEFNQSMIDYLRHMDLQRRIWIEEETENIGKVGIPFSLMKQMQSAPAVCLHSSISHRVQRIKESYHGIETNELKVCVAKLRSRLGEKKISEIISALENQEMLDVITSLLDYYDQAYGHQFKNKAILETVEVDGISPKELAQKIGKMKYDLKIEKSKNIICLSH